MNKWMSKSEKKKKNLSWKARDGSWLLPTQTSCFTMGSVTNWVSSSWGSSFSGRSWYPLGLGKLWPQKGQAHHPNLLMGLPSPTHRLPDKFLSSQDFHSPGGQTPGRGRLGICLAFICWGGGDGVAGGSGTAKTRVTGEILTGWLGLLPHRKRPTSVTGRTLKSS